MRLNEGSGSIFKCGNVDSGNLRKLNVGKRIAARGWTKKGELKPMGKERNEMSQEEKRTFLLGMSVCCEHRATAWKHRQCRSLHQPAFHHHDSCMNCNLICNTIILAHIRGYITLRAKSWPQSAEKKPLLRRSNVLDSMSVCGAPERLKVRCYSILLASVWRFRKVLALHMICSSFFPFFPPLP